MDKTVTSEKLYAPVLISVYDRRKHLEACIEALKKNPEAKDTPLYIVSDGWHHEGHRKAIEEVREYINTITGFKEVNTRFRKTNWGMRKSGPDAIDWVFDIHDRLIRMEDDIICSPHYLRYMNEALATFEHDDRIIAICAHTNPKFRAPANYPHDIYLWNSYTPWGFAIWKDRWTRYLEFTPNEPQRIAETSVWRDLKKIRPLLTPRKNYLDGNVHNDSRFGLHIFLNKKFCVFPVHTLTMNEGMDGSGTNCGHGWTYPPQFLKDSPICITPEIEPNTEINQVLYRAQYSIINHGVGGILRSIGIFHPLYKCYKTAFRKRQSPESKS